MRFVGQGWRALAPVVLVAMAAACGDGGTAAPVATALVAASPTTLTGVAATAVTEVPSVRVTDQSGQPMAGVAVTFQVLSGGGSVTGGSATTNASGVATVGSWTLGATPGANTMSATAAGLTPVVFTATAQDPCAVRTTFLLSAPATGSLAAQDCRLNTGEYVDFFSVAVPTAQALSFSLASTAFDAYLLMFDAAGRAVAISDDAAAGTSNSLINVFAPAGNYFLGATSFDVGETGAYQLSSTTFVGNVNCGEYWVLPGVQINGQISATDCNFGGFLVDEYLVVLRPGETITVQMNSTALNAALFLFNGAGEVVASNDNGGGGTNALLTYTATGLDIFYIDATSASGTGTGAYSLAVTRAGGDAATDGAALDGTVRLDVKRGARRLPALAQPAGR
jgi:hypothetical protein